MAMLMKKKPQKSRHTLRFLNRGRVKRLAPPPVDPFGFLKPLPVITLPKRKRGRVVIQDPQLYRQNTIKRLPECVAPKFITVRPKRPV